VFVVDKTLFASREDHPVSEVFIMKETRLSTQIFRLKLVLRGAAAMFFQVETKHVSVEE